MFRAGCGMAVIPDGSPSPQRREADAIAGSFDTASRLAAWKGHEHPPECAASSAVALQCRREASSRRKTDPRARYFPTRAKANLSATWQCWSWCAAWGQGRHRRGSHGPRLPLRRFGGGRRNVRCIGAKWQNMSWRIDCRTRWKRLIGVARCWRSAGHS